jgi:hypothetical protein
MAVSQTPAIGISARTAEQPRAAASSEVDARMAGWGLLAAIASIVVLYGGSSAIAGTRPDHASSAAAVAAFYGHAGLTGLFLQAAIGVLALVFFALAFRRYALRFVPGAVDQQLLDLGTALVLIEAPVLVVEFGMQLSLVRLAGLGDPGLLGVFMAWTWIDNGVMLLLEVGWLGVLSLAAWRSGALPRWLAGFGLLFAALISIVAAPSLPLNYPDGLTMIAYGPFIAWFIAAGIYLVRGGRRALAVP